MRVLVYKRTHPDDPDANGCFGAQDCMGMIRARRFDAVIGVGGLGQEPRSHLIAGKINWIGIGPRRGEWYRRGPLVTFAQFRDFGTEGESFRARAPHLASRMYGRRMRHVMTDSMTEAEQREVRSLLALADGAPPSHPPAAPRERIQRGCKPICKRRCK